MRANNNIRGLFLSNILATRTARYGFAEEIVRTQYRLHNHGIILTSLRWLPKLITTRKPTEGKTRILVLDHYSQVGGGGIDCPSRGKSADRGVSPQRTFRQSHACLARKSVVKEF